MEETTRLSRGGGEAGTCIAWPGSGAVVPAWCFSLVKLDPCVLSGLASSL